MQRKVAGALVVALALALGTAGCGGSGPLTKAEFVKQGNAACIKARTRAERIPVDPKAKGVESLLAKAAAYEHAKLAGIEALAPPDELQVRYEQFKHAVAARGAFFKKSSGRTIKSLDAISVEFAELQKQEDETARALNLTKCLEGQ
jgi:hypothetical protein